MIDQPGAIDNIFHRTLDEDPPFQFINVAHWESPEALANALATSTQAQADGGSGVAQDFERLHVRMSQNNYIPVATHGLG